LIVLIHNFKYGSNFPTILTISQHNTYIFFPPEFPVLD